MSPVAPFLDTLEAAANQAASTETEFRRHAAQRIAQLERDRSFAFRRLSIMRAVSDAVSRAESKELAVAGAVAILRSKLGWSNDSEARSAVLTEFARVAESMFAGQQPEEAPAADVLDLLAAFERWYDETHPAPFWTLFEQPMPETPLVDF
ncbi:MAG TPA: hypothetical protein VFE34_01780 [Dongiaceae bacterium]|jgi:hypothetical protein|nr:hypothetical protein [Dongiaceae bacterium]